MLKYIKYKVKKKNGEYYPQKRIFFLWWCIYNDFWDQETTFCFMIIQIYIPLMFLISEYAVSIFNYGTLLLSSVYLLALVLLFWDVKKYRVNFQDQKLVDKYIENLSPKLTLKEQRLQKLQKIKKRNRWNLLNLH